MGLRRTREDRHGAGIAFDTLDLAKKIKPDQAKAWMKSLGDNGEDEGKVLRRQIEEFLESLGKGGTSAARLKDAWSLFRRPLLFARAGLARHGQFDRVCDPDRSPWRPSFQALCPGSASLYAVPVLHLVNAS